MSDTQLIETIKAGNSEAAENLLNAGADVNQQDEHGWTALNWAAGMGDLAVVRLLLDRGADARKVGRDQRTAYKIALAAGRLEVAKLLREVEARAGEGARAQSERSYSRAYLLKDLRAYPGWREARLNRTEADDPAGGDGGQKELADDDVAFLQHDLTVTASMWSDENVIFDHVTQEWEEYCGTVLQFEVPDDLQLIVEARGETQEQSV